MDRLVRGGRILCAALLLLAPALAAAEPGAWVLAERQVEKPRPYPPGFACTFSHDVGDQGLSFTQVCSWPGGKKSDTQRCHFGWSSAPGLASLKPGQKVRFTGTASNGGGVGKCAGYIVMRGAKAFDFEVGPGAKVSRTGEITIPDRLVNPRTNQTTPLELLFHVTGGNETRFVALHLWYKWAAEAQGGGAAPPVRR